MDGHTSDLCYTQQQKVMINSRMYDVTIYVKITHSYSL